MTGAEASVLDAIAVGVEHARTLPIIARLARVSERTAQGAIETIRKERLGRVCSGSRGYWRPRTAAEYASNVERRHERALTQLATVGAERAEARAMAAEEARLAAPEPLALPWAVS
jgi:hypothetical protein